MIFSAVILAGGKSSRMGRDKAWLEVNGEPLLARQIRLARAAGAAEIVISGRAGTDYSGFGCRVLQDRFPEAGPLAGIERALAESLSPLVLALAVDMPNLTPGFLQMLAAGCGSETGAIPRTGGGVEPLAAFYPKASWTLADKSLRANSNAVQRFAELCVNSGLATFLEFVPPQADLFKNWNSPVDLQPCPA